MFIVVCIWLCLSCIYWVSLQALRKYLRSNCAAKPSCMLLFSTITPIQSFLHQTYFIRSRYASRDGLLEAFTRCEIRRRFDFDATSISFSAAEVVPCCDFLCCGHDYHFRHIHEANHLLPLFPNFLAVFSGDSGHRCVHRVYHRILEAGQVQLQMHSDDRFRYDGGLQYGQPFLRL